MLVSSQTVNSEVVHVMNYNFGANVSQHLLCHSGISGCCLCSVHISVFILLLLLLYGLNTRYVIHCDSEESQV